MAEPGDISIVIPTFNEAEIIGQVVADAAIKGAVMTSGKDSFSGGADITMLQKMLGLFHAERAKDPQRATKLLFDGVGRMGGLWRKMETSGKPWVSAINGTCMGGAFELSLACHGRVAADSDKVKMGLPEVKVGLFPGAGGSPTALFGRYFWCQMMPPSGGNLRTEPYM